MSSLKSRTGFSAAALAGALIFASAAMAADPIFDSARPMSGPTAGSASEASRSFQRDIARVPTVTERFGIPTVSGTLPEVRQQPVFDTPDNAWPPAINRARAR